MPGTEPYGDVGFGGQSAAPFQNEALQEILKAMGNASQFDNAFGLGANLLEKKALGGSPDLQAAEANVANTLSGQFLPGGKQYNQAEQAAVNQAERQILPRVNSQFEGAGQPTSALARKQSTEDLGNVVGEQFAQNYEQERRNQLAAAGLSPQLANADFLGARQLLGLGQYGAQDAMDALRGIASGATRPTYSNPWEQGIGAGLGILGALGGIL